jgi:hypothetical protein
LLYFHTWTQNISIIFAIFHPFLLSFPLSLVPIPRQDLFYFPLLQLFKCILLIQGSFALVFQTCLYSALIRLTPILFTLSPSSCFPIIQ